VKPPPPPGYGFLKVSIFLVRSGPALFDEQETRIKVLTLGRLVGLGATSHCDSPRQRAVQAACIDMSLFKNYKATLVVCLPLLTQIFIGEPGMNQEEERE
jgi:hypothetical protein